MNLPIQGSPDPKDDTHNKEDISEVRSKILDQRECIHDFQELGNDLLECRLCGERSRFGDIKPETERVFITLPGLPGAFQNLYVPRSMLHEYILDHIDRYKNFKASV